MLKLTHVAVSFCAPMLHIAMYDVRVYSIRVLRATASERALVNGARYFEEI